MLITILTLITLLLFGTQAEALTVERAKNFVRALAESSDNLKHFHHPEELAMSERLGIVYESVPHKFMLGYDLSSESKALILESDTNWSVEIENQGDSWSILQLNFTSEENGRVFYFQDDHFVTPIRYFSRGFSKMESRFFRFLIEDKEVFHPAAAAALDSFVLSAASELALDNKALEKLEREKILYLHCCNPESIERFTGFKIRGMGVLSHDCIVTTFNAHYHEVAHLLIAFKLKHLGPYSHPLLGEGLAVALGGRGGRDSQTVLDVGYYLLRSGLVDLNTLLNEKNFIGEEVSFSYPASGLYVRFLLDNMGTEPFLELYRKYCRSEIADRDITIASEDISETGHWNDWLDGWKQFGPVEIVGKLPPEGDIILERYSDRVLDCGDRYCFFSG